MPSHLRRLHTQGQIVERTCGDDNRAVSGGVDGVRLSRLQGRANAAFLLCKIADGWSYPVLCCSLCYLSLCTPMNFAYDSLFEFEVFAVRSASPPHVCGRDQERQYISGERSLGVWQLLICSDWAKIAEERHGLNAQLQTKLYDYSEGHKPYEYTYNKSINPSFAERKFHGCKITHEIRKNCAPWKFGTIQ